MCNIEFPLTMKKIYLFNKKKWHKFVIKILLLLIFCFICSTMIWSQTALHCKHHCCFIWNRFNIPFTYIHKILILYILHCTSITHAAVCYYFFFFSYWLVYLWQMYRIQPGLCPSRRVSLVVAVLFHVSWNLFPNIIIDVTENITNTIIIKHCQHLHQVKTLLANHCRSNCRRTRHITEPLLKVSHHFYSCL